jgi:predicted secreted protein
VAAFKRFAVACAFAVLLVALAGCGGSPQATAGSPVRVGEAANGTQVQLVVGQTLEIALPGNPTTGFTWAAWGALPSQVATAGDSYETSAPAGVVGAGGVQTLAFKALSAGTATLKLGYARPWESVQPAKTFEVTLVIK